MASLPRRNAVSLPPKFTVETFYFHESDVHGSLQRISDLGAAMARRPLSPIIVGA